MKVLIIEDDSVKSQVVKAFLRDALCMMGEAADLSESTHLSDAVRLVTTNSFELIVLDLMLPYLSDGPASASAGIEMLNQIRHAHGANRGASVIGLSAFPEEVQEFRDSFDRASVLITKFDDSGSWQSALHNMIIAVIHRRAAKHPIDFLIFNALEEERAGYHGTDLNEVGETITAGLNVKEVALLADSQTFKGALIQQRQMGLAAATLDASIALSAFQARIVCMSGICAGFTGRAVLGQLIIASPAWEYQAGKWARNDFEIAPAQIPLPAHTRVVLDQIVASATFHDAIEHGIDRKVVRPSHWTPPILAPVATGSAVIADETRLHHIQQQHRKVTALDMETFGIYYAAHEVRAAPRHYFSIKCVVDLANAEKGDLLHEYGCAASARATIFLLRRLLVADKDLRTFD